VIHVTATCSSCRALTGGVSAFDVEAASVHEMIRALDTLHPGLGEHVRTRMAVAIDGEIHQDALLEPLRDGAEVVLIPRIGGG
jgi:molybdopterin converting factor small subunit